MSGLANFSSKEGEVCNVEIEVEFPWRARKVTIINDSSTRALEFKFNATEAYGTLKPNEEVSLNHLIRIVYLNSPTSSTVAYRVWGFG